MRHAGILPGPVETAPTRWLDMPPGCFSFAPAAGLVETMMDLGARVAAGDYTGYRLRGAAGALRLIRAADYATASFWVEPGEKAAPPPS